MGKVILTVRCEDDKVDAKLWTSGEFDDDADNVHFIDQSLDVDLGQEVNAALKKALQEKTPELMAALQETVARVSAPPRPKKKVKA